MNVNYKIKVYYSKLSLNYIKSVLNTKDEIIC